MNFNQATSDIRSALNRFVDSAIRVFQPPIIEQYGAGGLWTCSNCSYHSNRSDSGYCVLCGSPPPFGTSSVNANEYVIIDSVPPNTGFWTCSLCQHVNEPSSTSCSACTLNKSERTSPNKVPVPPQPGPHTRPVVNSSDGSASNWSCDRCTFMIQDSASICPMCGKSRNSSETRTTDSGSSVQQLVLIRQASLLTSEQRDKEYEDIQNIWQNIIDVCKKHDVSFVDDSFPPNDNSIFLSVEQTSNMRHGPDTKWFRATNIRAETSPSDYNLSWTVYREPRPSDILQGSLGDCWFLSALAVLSERKDLIENVVVTKQFNREGAYLIRLCCMGQWQIVIVDDNFPCSKHRNFLYSASSRRQLWVPLIEKAYAKIHGCYESLVSGNTIEALNALTGLPCEVIDLKAAKFDLGRPGIQATDDTWALLLSYKAAGYLMCASCGHREIDETVYESVGLISSHAYSIMDVKHLDQHRLVQLRNPWGSTLWRGNWCDNSPLWQTVTEEHRKVFNPNHKNDGLFWMSVEDLITYFSEFDVCKTRADWQESRMPGVLYPHCGRFLQATLISVWEPTETDISVFQDTGRGKFSQGLMQTDMVVAIFRLASLNQLTAGRIGEQNEPETRLAALEPIVGRLVNCSNKQIKSCVSCNELVEAGQYIVLAMGFSHWQREKEMLNTLTIHSTKSILTEQVRISPYSLADAVIQMAISKGSQSKMRDGVTAYYLTEKWCGFIIVVENRMPSHYFHCQCDCSNSLNVVSTRNTLCVADSVPPLHRQVIMVLSQLERSERFSLTQHFIQKVSPLLNLYDWVDKPGTVDHHPPFNSQTASLHIPRMIL